MSRRFMKSDRGLGRGIIAIEVGLEGWGLVLWGLWGFGNCLIVCWSECWRTCFFI